jgi:hypothetical protein
MRVQLFRGSRQTVKPQFDDGSPKIERHLAYKDSNLDYARSGYRSSEGHRLPDQHDPSRRAPIVCSLNVGPPSAANAAQPAPKSEQISALEAVHNAVLSRPKHLWPLTLQRLSARQQEWSSRSHEVDCSISVTAMIKTREEATTPRACPPWAITGMGNPKGLRPSATGIYSLSLQCDKIILDFHHVRRRCSCQRFVASLSSRALQGLT